MMRSKGWAVWILLLGGFSLGFTGQQTGWQKSRNGFYDAAMIRLYQSPSVLFAASDKALYQSLDNGQTFQKMAAPDFSSGSIRDIHVERETIYVVTSNGLWEGTDLGRSWSKTFSASQEDGEECLSAHTGGGKTYLGTSSGLYIREGRRWAKVSEFPNEPVYHFASSSKAVFAATSHKVYIITKNKVSAVYSAYQDEEEGSAPHVKDIAAFGNDQEHLLLVTGSGAFYSPDQGKRWTLVPVSNMVFSSVTSVYVPEQDFTSCVDMARCVTFWITSYRGVFEVTQGRANPVYKGMETNVAYDLIISKERVLAATDRGVFAMPLRNEMLPKNVGIVNGKESLVKGESNLVKRETDLVKRETVFRDTNNEIRDTSYQLPVDSGQLPVDRNTAQESYQELSGRFENEPSINQVHRWAVDYAEVHPEKISEWRRLAKKRALFPSFSIGVDGGRDWDRGNSIWGSYTSGGQSYVGPDDKSRGADIGFDVSLSWDLADFIWSTDQTTIDSRSKLMVELREDVLDQATRIYFERRRTQFELLGELDGASRLDKDMRVAELTALLDVFTGGKFSGEGE